MLADYRVHPEAKSLGPDGHPCDKQTIGLLVRRHVTPIPSLRHRGKEGNRIDEREAGVADPRETHTEYHEPGQDPLWQLAISVLRKLPAAPTASAAGVSTRTVKRARAGQPISKASRTKLTNHVLAHARAQVRSAGIRPATDPEALLARWFDLQRPDTPPSS